MKYYELIPGRRYITTIRELPFVRFVELRDHQPEWGDGNALISVEHRGNLYLMASDQIIREA